MGLFGRDHAIISASKAEQWWNCPGSVYLSEQAPPETKKSVYAEEGTLAAKIAEDILTDWLINDVDILGAYNGHKSKFPNDEMAGHIWDYCMYVAKLIARQEIERVGVEKSFLLDSSIQAFGTSDVAFAFISTNGLKSVHIIDLKYGQGVTVEIKYPDGTLNKQCVYYLVAAHKDPDWGPFDSGFITIYQPRIEHEDGPIRTIRLCRSDMDTWYSAIMERAQLAYDQLQAKAPTFKAGSWCRWCKGQAICKAFLQEMQGDANIDFADTSAPTDLPEIIQLSDSQLKRLILGRELIESFLKRVEEFVTNRTIAGNGISGLKLVHGRSTRKWAQAEEATAEALLQLGCKEPFRKELVTITQAEKILGKNKINHLTKKTEPSLKLVEESDKRPAINPKTLDAESDFTPIEG